MTCLVFKDGKDEAAHLDILLERRKREDFKKKKSILWEQVYIIRIIIVLGKRATVIIARIEGNVVTRDQLN